LPLTTLVFCEKAKIEIMKTKQNNLNDITILLNIFVNVPNRPRN
jgi:hypothetical protein